MFLLMYTYTSNPSTLYLYHKMSWMIFSKLDNTHRNTVLWIKYRTRCLVSYNHEIISHFLAVILGTVVIWWQIWVWRLPNVYKRLVSKSTLWCTTHFLLQTPLMLIVLRCIYLKNYWSRNAWNIKNTARLYTCSTALSRLILIHKTL